MYKKLVQFIFSYHVRLDIAKNKTEAFVPNYTAMKINKTQGFISQNQFSLLTTPPTAICFAAVLSIEVNNI